MANGDAIRELLSETSLNLSEEQINQLSSGGSVTLDAPAGATDTRAAGNCTGYKLFCKTAGRFTCCLYVTVENGRLKFCANCTN
ncbi:MAG TPA: hypothetical protein VFJ16_32455 [Longimicrobium sp.]|nr:hypothetical protein [Longimicrobium sp.]